MLLTKEKKYAILHFLLSIKQSYVGSLSRYDTFCHIPKNNLRNTLSLILYCYIYLLQKAENKDFVFKKIRFLVQDTRKFDCKAQIKMREILFFSENKVVLLVYKQNKSGLINQICGMTPFLPSPLKTSKHNLYRFQSGLQMKRRKVITAKLSIRVLIYNILIIVYWYQEIKVASSSQLSYSLSFIKSITLLNLE